MQRVRAKKTGIEHDTLFDYTPERNHIDGIVNGHEQDRKKLDEVIKNVRKEQAK